MSDRGRTGPTWSRPATTQSSVHRRGLEQFAALTRKLIEEHVRRPPPTAGVPTALRPLTERELEVFDLIAAGLSNDDIAARLVVSAATVKTHVNRIIAKLDGRTRAQLVVLAYECGLLRPGASRM